MAWASAKGFVAPDKSNLHLSPAPAPHCLVLVARPTSADQRARFLNCGDRTPTGIQSVTCTPPRSVCIADDRTPAITAQHARSSTQLLDILCLPRVGHHSPPPNSQSLPIHGSTVCINQQGLLGLPSRPPMFLLIAHALDRQASVQTTWLSSTVASLYWPMHPSSPKPAKNRLL